MTTHTALAPKKPKSWQQVKGKLIARFGTVKAAALLLGCHPNSLRLAAGGGARHIRTRMREQLGISL